MIKGKEFNQLIAKVGNEKLLPAGFVQDRSRFYLHRSPNIFVLLTNYYRFSFDGFYLAVTHDFLSNTKAHDQLVIPPSLESYPFSIGVEELSEQYKKHSYIYFFSYDTNFTSRIKKSSISLADKMRANEGIAEWYIRESMDKVLVHGLRLVQEYTPAISHLSVTRYPGDKHYTDRFRNEIKQYHDVHGMKMNIPGQKWYHRLLGF